MRIVLDTGVFWSRAALQALWKIPAEIVIPAIAYAERRRQVLREGQSVSHFEDLIRVGRFQVEAFGREDGDATSRIAYEDAVWARHARDAMIAAHVRPEDELWTSNPKDFLKLGLRPDQVKDVRRGGTAFGGIVDLG